MGTFVEKDRECERDCRKYSARNIFFFAGEKKRVEKKESLWCLLKIFIEEPK